MNPIVCIPIPMDDESVWALFKPFIQRFADTWRKFPPGVDCDLIAVVNNADATNELHEIFDGLPVHFTRYDGAGADIGSFQQTARQNPGRFMFCCVSRVYFHRAGWLARIMEAREQFGFGLYGTSASNEGGRFHICTRAYAMDTDLFNAYPHVITSRDQGTFFEIGRDNPVGPFSEWAEKQGEAAIVLWDWTLCPYRYEGDSHKFITNGYRSGNQEQMLAWDKHTDAYRDADDDEKARLSAMMRGEL
jgi:hypothetical protein